MPTIRAEQRREERVRAAFRVDLGGASGLTRDISATGIFFETDAPLAAGGTVNLDIAIETPGGPIMMSYVGRVVRLERRESRLGVAVRILESAIRPAGSATPGPDIPLRSGGGGLA
jgi:hypothetical protein